MKKEAESNAEADRKEREKIDKINTADSLIFQTEKQMKEIGDKIPGDKRSNIEAALNDLKEAHKSQDMNRIDTATSKLNDAWQAASQDIYQASQGQPGAESAQDNSQDNNANSGSDNSGDVTDVDYEEVK